jgi:hypothetical protein
MRRAVCLLLSPVPPVLLLAALSPLSALRIGGGSGVDTATMVTLALPAQTTEPVAPGEATEPIRPLRRTPASELPDPAAVPQSLPASAATDNENGAIQRDADHYLPAAQLTERPQVLRDIAPEWTQQPLPQPVECVLLISEFGDIDRVVINSSALTSAQRQALRERLLAARFVPGKLYGRPVKTALRIEVQLH